MKRVVTVDLNGNAYQLDEDGYELLRNYLESARGRLGANPDLEEIMADLEQAIADKARRFLNSGKSVVSGDEIERVVEEMGPVDSPIEADEAAGEAAAEPSGGAHSSVRARWLPRELYRLTGEDEKMVAGVCAGIAAHFGIDVSIVRIAFVALMFVTSGLFLLGYLLLIAIIPEAKTPEEQAAAYGAPFDARGVIDQARSRFGELGNDGRKRQGHAQVRYRGRTARGGGHDRVGSLLGFVVLFFGAIFGIYVLVGFVRWISAPVLVNGTGPMILHSPMWWAPALVLLAGAAVLASVARGGRNSPSLLVSLLSTSVQILLLLFVIWFAYRAFPFVREVLDGTVIALHRVFN